LLTNAKLLRLRQQFLLQYIRNYFDFLDLFVFFCLSPVSDALLLCAEKRNDSVSLAGSVRRQVVSSMKADAMFSRSGDHQELVFPVEGKN
jgi:hypothetical protein